jgi:hypothetical protein
VTATDIPASMRDVVVTRDAGVSRATGRGGRGINLHHRWLRSQGGEHTPQNLVSLDGSGTTGAHGWVHANVHEATLLGLIVPAHLAPETVPVLLSVPRSARGRHAWYLLLPNAHQVLLTAAETEAAMRGLGVWADHDFPHPGAYPYAKEL